MNPITATSSPNEWIVQHQVALRHHFEQCLYGHRRAHVFAQCREAVHAALSRRLMTTVVAVAAVMLLTSLWI
jgi:hypothetical protein